MTTVTITWNSLQDQFNPSVENERWTLLTEMLNSNLTDGIGTKIDDLSNSRSFVDQESATLFITRLTQICNKHNVTPPTFTQL